MPKYVSKESYSGCEVFEHDPEAIHRHCVYCGCQLSPNYMEFRWEHPKSDCPNSYKQGGTGVQGWYRDPDPYAIAGPPQPYEELPERRSGRDRRSSKRLP